MLFWLVLIEKVSRECWDQLKALWINKLKNTLATTKKSREVDFEDLISHFFSS